MKKNNFRPLIYAAILLIVAVSCKVDELNKPSITNTTPPGVVSNVTVVNQNGKATLTYTIPKDADLSYVKAVYETKPGVILEVKASYYTNTMVLGGYADTLSHIVKLYAVNTSETISAPISVTVNPLTPAIKLAFRTLVIKPAFGGFSVVCQNPTKDNLSIIALVDTAGKGKYIQTIGMDNIYSSDLVIKKTTRSQPAIQRKYAFMVRDRWLNQTDTLFQDLTPIFEQSILSISPTTFSDGAIPGDTPIKPGSGANLSKIWDNKAEGWPNLYFGDESAGAPTAITINLNKKHALSRFRIKPYKELGNAYFVRGNLKNFEVYGSNAPGSTGSFTDGTWTLLGSYTSIKPSGGPLGIETAQDLASGDAGWDFDFPDGTGSYQWLRIRCTSNWQGSYFMSISEFYLWGV
jgi:hypothetical protein